MDAVAKHEVYSFLDGFSGKTSIVEDFKYLGWKLLQFMDVMNVVPLLRDGKESILCI